MNATREKQTTRTYDVLVEKAGENGYTARVLAWPDCTVQAPTREEALRYIRTLILERLAKAEIVTLEIKPEEVNHPWLPFAGMWADDPTFDDFVAEMERYRRERNTEWWNETTEEEASQEAVLV